MTGLPAGGAGRARRPSRRQWAILLILPALIPTGAVVVSALVSAVLLSLGLTPLVGRPRLSLEAWRAPADLLWTAAGLSVGIAAAATAVAVLVGFGAALAVTGRRGSRLVAVLSTVTIPVPHLVRAAAIGLLLADSGVLPV